MFAGQKAMNFIDLFCGAGLGARGAVNAGAMPVLAVDSWDLATCNYKTNFPAAEVITSRIEDLDPYQLSRHFQTEVILASPECTAHSIAKGAKAGLEESRVTALGILPWIGAFSPRWVVIENVVRMRKWARHAELKNKIVELGYQVREFVLNAADFGAPQARKRLFLVCARSEIPPGSMERYFVPERKSAESIIDWSGRWHTSPLFTPARASNTLQRAERAISELGRGVPFIIVYYGSDYAGGWQTLDAPLRTITTLDRFALVTFENGEYMMRMLQPDELLRAMGANDHKLLFGNRREKVKLCGNGVCTNVTEAIFREIITTARHQSVCERAI